MLATSNGGDKISRNRNSLRLLGITAYAEEFSICGREIKCFFCWLLRNFSPFTQRFFGVPARGRYHYPRCAIHAVETLDARGSRRRIRRFYAAPEFALCGLKIPAAGTHATPAPNRAHSGSHGETRGVSDGGWYHYPRSVLRGSETLRGRVSERQTLPLFGLGQVCSRRAQRAFGTAMCSCASLFRGVAAPLGCVIPLLFLSPH